MEKTIRSQAGAILMLGAILLLAPRTSGAQTPERLFAAVGGPATASGASGMETATPVRVDTAALRRLAAAGSGSLELNIAPGTAPRAVQTAVVRRSPSDFSWFGAIEGDPGGTVRLAVVNEAVIAHIESAQLGNLRVRPLAGGGHALEPFEEAAGCLGVASEPADELAASPGRAAIPGRNTPVGSEDGTVQDVMVFYTPQARIDAGGEDAILAFIQLGLDYANQAYINSLINLRLRIVHIAETPYTESGDLGIDLNRLRAPGDGNVDEWHTLRPLYAADLTSLIVAAPGGGIAGILLSLGSSGSTSAQVTGLASVPGGTWAHEFGHNQGACHARGDGGGCDSGGIFSYSWGHRFTGASMNESRTIMAYSPGTRIQYFSNPLVNFDGTPTGVQVGLPGEADNALTISQTRATVANFFTHLLRVEPEVGYFPTGLEGGPFAPPCATYTLTNDDSIPYDWQVTTGVPWLTISPSSGTLAPGAFVDVDVCLTAGVTTFTPGLYEAVLTFENVSCGTIRDRAVGFRVSGDCNGNLIPDETDIAMGTSQDCNGTGVPDECELASGVSQDCDFSGVPDECEEDCNGNGLHDSCDIAAGTSLDCDSDGIPDDCEPDCNSNMVADDCDIAMGTSQDCNGNGIPDECEPDCNGNEVADSCDIAMGTSQDCNGNGVPDECEPDCNMNGIPDPCELLAGTTTDLSPVLSPFSGSPAQPASHIVIGAATALDDVLLNFTANGDYASTSEFVNVSLNGVLVGPVFVSGFSDCGLQSDSLLVTPAAWNQAVATGGGNVTIGLVATISVNDICDDTIQVETIVPSIPRMTPDCNENGIPDDCETDCNGNGIPDDCDLTPGAATFASPELSPLTGTPPQPVFFMIPGAPTAIGAVALDFESVADLGLTTERVTVDLNGLVVGDVFDEADADCVMRQDSLLVPAAAWNSAVTLGAGDVTIGMTASSAVDPLCANSIRVGVAVPYTPAASQDCDLSGVPDECETDCNSNGVHDSCDVIGGTVIDNSPLLGPLTGDPEQPQSHVVAGAPAAITDVTLSFESAGDFAAPTEFVNVFLNGVFAGQVFVTPGVADCATATENLIIPFAEWNSARAAGAGDVTIEMRASLDVGAFCANTIRVNTTVTGAPAFSQDANMNGIPDECEAAPTATPGTCCPGDANNSGSFVDANDFIAVQANFGADNGIGGLGDANCSGSFVDANDFIAVQANFGADCG